MSWNGEGSLLFTSSSAPYDCFDNGPCDEVIRSVLVHCYSGSCIFLVASI